MYVVGLDAEVQQTKRFRRAAGKSAVGRGEDDALAQRRQTRTRAHRHVNRTPRVVCRPLPMHDVASARPRLATRAPAATAPGSDELELPGRPHLNQADIITL